MRIKRLSQHLANQIAAGEVIERPASIIKELVENSLDAKATKLIVTLTNGGIDGIIIEDDGVGIHPDDLNLSIQSHATSKLITTEDLNQITTFGFRGEALSSIHAISKLSILSKQDNNEIAWEINDNNKPFPSVYTKGTKISVHELFYNIPARKHFLKSVTTEYRHCLQVITRVALIRPDVYFQVYHNSKLVLDCPIDNKQSKTRLTKLIGKNFSDFAQTFLVEQDQWVLSGWLVSATVSQKNTDKQFLYVNNRPVKDRLLTGALRRAYADQLYQSNQPMYLINLKVPVDQVDVNVSPHKMEVRFKDQNIMSFVQAAVQQHIRRSLNDQAQQTHLTSNNQVNFSYNKNRTQPLLNESKPNYYQTKQHSNHTRFNSSDFSKIFNHLETTEDTIKSSSQLDPSDSVINPTPHNQPILEGQLIFGEAISFIHGAFILAVNQQGLIIVDAHAAHERVIYERLKQLHNNWEISSIKQQNPQTQPEKVQQLLMPIKISLNSIELSLAQEISQSLKSIGIDNQFKGFTWHILTIPIILQHLKIDVLLHEVLHEIDQTNHSNLIQEQIYQKLSSKACHQAVRANHILSIQEMNLLLRELEQCSSGGHCNHGRPTWWQITTTELNSWFSRGH